MSEKYDSLIIAKFFIDIAIKQGKPISPLKLQKLVYYAAGWYAGYTGRRLLDEEVKAWPYGPIIASIYHEFTHLGNDPITAKDVRFGVIDTGTPLFDQSLVDFMTGVWSAYCDFSDIQLSEMTKADGSPWAMIAGDGDNLMIQSIPFELIQGYFKTVVANVKVDTQLSAG